MKKNNRFRVVGSHFILNAQCLCEHQGHRWDNQSNRHS
jgi:hypothetical protein